MRHFFTLACLSITIALSGCATRHIKPPLPLMKSGELKQTYYQMRTTTADGITLSFTVYQPKLSAQQTAPLILHTHGFGLSRMKRPWLDIYGSIMPTGEAAERAWQRGYWVISYDQRGHGGFGGSGGKIRIADPEKEAQDVRLLMDWAEKNLPQLARNANGVRAGMVGESYAGGVQYIASSLDKRLQALVPVTTWYDLETSLAPSGIPKTGWINVLNLIGDWWNWNKFDPVLKQAYQDSQKGFVAKPTYDFLKTHQARWFCENQQAPQADALIIQGFRDVLFPFNEGLKAANCLKQAQRDVRLIGIHGGHLQPLVQHSPGLKTPIWYMDKTIQCPQRKLVIQDTIALWFDSKLKDQTSADLKTIPELCIDGSPITSAEQLTANTVYPLSDTEINIKQAQPVFIPLTRMQQHRWLTGIPKLQLKVKALDQHSVPVLFVSIAVKTKNSQKYRVLNEQAMPISSKKLQQRNQIVAELGYPVDHPDQAMDLPAINTELKAGDTLGLLISSRSRYFASNSQSKALVSINGHISLPAAMPIP
jgi:ABC-2 type transport system ATP-binding protein